MRDIEKNFTKSFSSFDQMEGHSTVRGMNDWAVPWADLMMVMFVLFVVLFVYANTHQDVKVLFSQQSADSAQSTSTLDPLIGLIGQIASRADSRGTSEIVSIADNKVLYRSRADGVSVVREGQDRIRITLRGELFFSEGDEMLKPDALQYIQEIAQVIKLSIGTVHVVGYASTDESEGTESFELSTRRAADVADFLMSEYDIAPKRIIVTGRGSYLPERPGTSANNQSLNRRVEIVITNEI